MFTEQVGTWWHCPSFMSAAVTKYPDQKQLRARKGLFYSLYVIDISEGRQGRHSESGLLGIPYSMTANQGTHFTAKEVEQEPERHAGGCLLAFPTGQFTLC